MSETQVITGRAYGTHGSIPGLLETNLHLVLGLDLILGNLGHGDDGIRRLENVRNCLPGVTVTFFTDLRASDAVELLSEASILPPDHLLAEVGMTLHHRSAAGDMEADPDYREWLDFQYETKNRLGVAKAIGLEYLEMCWHSPRPLMVVGSPGSDLPILGLADIPVFTEIPGTKGGIPAVLTCRPFHLSLPALSEVVKLLLAYLSARSGDWFIRYAQPRKRPEHSHLETLTENTNALRIQSKRLGRRRSVTQGVRTAAPQGNR